MRPQLYFILIPALLLLVLALVAWLLFKQDTQLQQDTQRLADQQIEIDATYTAQEVDSRIYFIVLHFTGLNFKDSLQALTEHKVSAHYLVPERPIDGKNIIYQLVKDELKAAHAGLSYWQGHAADGQINLNASSIGVEIVNLGYPYKNGERQWVPYTEHQIQLLIGLLSDLIKKYNIPPTRIVGHGDITPNIAARGKNTRVDPGPLFPWDRLAAAGIGAWYDKQAVIAMLENEPEEEIDMFWLQENLAKYGYNLEKTGHLDQQTRNVVTAFQMHFRPSDYTGTPDQETCAILKNLIDKYFPE